MAVLKCEACGAPLPFQNGALISTCEYCGTKNVFDNIVSANSETDRPQENPLVLSLSGIGQTIFEKKTFNVYRTYAELIDTKSQFTEAHIDFKSVVKFGRAHLYGNAIKFKMSNGKKYIVRFMWASNENSAVTVLNGLINNSKRRN